MVAAVSAKKSTLLMSGITLCKTMIGIGIFSLPLGLKTASTLPGLVVTIVVGMIAALSFYMIGFCCHAWDVATLRGAWYKAVGPNSRFGCVVDWTLFVSGNLILITYCIVMADFFSGAAKGFFGEGSPFVLSRMSTMLTSALVVLLPLCLKPNLQSLAFTSALGLVALGYAMFLIYYDAFTSPSLNVGEARVPLVKPGWGVFETVALCSHAFVAHYNAPGLYREMEDNTLSRWATLVGVSYISTTLIYASFAYTGIMRFGMTTEGNVLRMLEPTPPVLCAWVAIGLSTALTYPLVFAAFRESAMGLACHLGGSLPEKLSPERHETLRRALTVVFVAFTATVGGLCDDLGIANALTGAVTGSLVTFTFPGLMFYAALGDLSHRARVERNGPLPGYGFLRATALGVAAVGLVSMTVGSAVVLNASASHSH